ncbi:alkaline shock response membrane anchor protein AmaP [Actinomadura rudentiformis]|uniref:Alkaline shock response membrane anchor protein AmaP n=1 Tax=Actinomadura rudentiformis TaxID=359158 RepID=A0A6H9YX36_9ACTN|nr:alkaline shock response membrane anchor protein AmaP [Actinomadura rudentiformis]KAB2347012.1 alkaline shock response membrane anchor protein AmaP [Actinomadura rudentiformis]
MDRKAAFINRTGLTVLGLLLTAGGGAILTRAVGWWGPSAESAPVLTDAMRRFPGEHSWFWPSVAAGACALALIGVAWLLAQARSEKLPGLSLEADDSGGQTRVSSDAVTSALEEEIEALPGVRAARARLLGDKDHPRLMLNVAYGARANLETLRKGIEDKAVTHVRAALDLNALPTVVRLSLVPGQHRRNVA